MKLRQDIASTHQVAINEVVLSLKASTFGSKSDVHVF